MRKFQISLKISATALLAVVLSMPTLVTAEELELDESRPRYRLADNFVGYAAPKKVQAQDHVIPASEFAWDKLTNNSPASGADPIIGRINVASYYDFKDGNPYPYFMLKQKP